MVFVISPETVVCSMPQKTTALFIITDEKFRAGIWNLERVEHNVSLCIMQRPVASYSRKNYTLELFINNSGWKCIMTNNW